MSAYRDWFVGMRVVCIDASLRRDLTPYPVAPDRDLDGLTERRIYTVRSVGLYRGALVVWLAEIIRRVRRNEEEFGEAGFAIERFRPVQPRATDISMFTSMLTGAKERERA